MNGSLRQAQSCQSRRAPPPQPCRLSCAILGQGKLAEAVPLPVAGYNGLKERKGGLPNMSPEDELNEAMDWLVLLAELRADLPQAAEWKAEVEGVRRVSDVVAVRRWLILTDAALVAAVQT